MTKDEMIHNREPSQQIERAIQIMHLLRAPGGCPWDAEQTHTSLIPNMIEECYECVDALQAGDMPHLREELGDVLLQVLFHAEIAQDNGHFTLADVACELADKLVRRHPHIFGDAQVDNADAVLSQWDQIKRKEQNITERPYLQNCGKGLPALLRSVKLTKKAAKVGFDWPDESGVLAKLQEEIAEYEACATLPADAPEVEEELGDILFSAVNLCRKRGVNPELALTRCANKFEQRFALLEQELREKSISLTDASLDEMEEAWQKAKAQEK